MDLSSQISSIFQQICNNSIVGIFTKYPETEDYLEVIKHPMSINIIWQKIQENEYSSYQQFEDDFELIKSNSQTFFGEKSFEYISSNIIYLDVKEKVKKIAKISQNPNDNISNLPDAISKFPSNIDFINIDDLNNIIELFKSKVLTLKTILKHFKCSYKTFTDVIEKSGIEYPDLKGGKKRETISEEHIQIVKDTLKKWHAGYQSISQYTSFPEREVRNIFTIINNKDITEEVKANSHTKRFSATEINYIWHTDIHYLTKKPPFLNETTYIVAFLDDCSRKILHYKIGSEKTQNFVIEALNECIQYSRSKPYILTTDNGGEFTGNDIENFLVQNQINHWKTKPYTPQQNGKIERFWRRIEQLENYNDIPHLIFIYNTKLENKSLRTLAANCLNINVIGKSITPEFIYQTVPRFVNYHDGIVVQFDTAKT